MTLPERVAEASSCPDPRVRGGKARNLALSSRRPSTNSSRSTTLPFDPVTRSTHKAEGPAQKSPIRPERRAYATPVPDKRGRSSQENKRNARRAVGHWPVLASGKKEHSPRSCAGLTRGDAGTAPAETRRTRIFPTRERPFARPRNSTGWPDGAKRSLPAGNQPFLFDGNHREFYQIWY